MSIEVRGITRTYGSFVALDGVNLRVEGGELVALLGPSGSGKTTLLRIVAGLDAPDPGRGVILFNDRDVANQPVGERGVGFVFQHYALFRHMTVFDNVAYGLRVRPRRSRPSRAEIRRRVHELLSLVQLSQLADRYPSQLSGGQRQRIALARALAVEPQILLLDEPFGALDAQVRQELRRWLRRLHDEIHLTSIFVTHDQEEALEVADRVVVMNSGRIEQIGTPERVFHQPASEFVMSFLGNVNVLQGRSENGRMFFGPLEVESTSPYRAAAHAARAFVRPHEMDVAIQPNGKPSFPATIRHINAAGARVRVELLSETGQEIHVELPHERYRALDLRRDRTVFVSPRSLKVFVDDYVI